MMQIIRSKLTDKPHTRALPHRIRSELPVSGMPLSVRNSLIILRFNNENCMNSREFKVPISRLKRVQPKGNDDVVGVF
jgi:hypothetical protein